ncbi:uncharacterized protein F5891DRAFT_975330 [Suillus fuscotomentosus]|uniref:Homeobox domain-containing protein n=1 Tax=Suillus fuscotomentosus TaxID=1912939 RepID=A0AAD4EI33_9AGAM|nr:uncharacterized protein F5891DRAFT_975330 [Suillus fuscotomentosus]KAG1906545.1 hypothetical protein F5891DRAFT_975330 [Suillus fuscotomentosus]
MSKKPIVRAKQWQLDILKKMHAEEARPSTSQRHQLAMETGLDEAWIRNWFMRKNRVPRPPVQTRPEGPLVHIIKLDPPQPDTSTCSDAPREGPSLSHPVVTQKMSILPPTSESLLASVGRADSAKSTWRLASGYSLPHSVEPRSVGYTSDATPALAIGSSSRSSYSSLGKEKVLQQNTRAWRYSRDPLHNRYPDFSKFFLPASSDTIGDAAKMPEFSSIAMPSLTHNPSSTDTALSLDSTFSTMQLRKMHKTRHLPVIEAAPKHEWFFRAGL